MCKACPEDGGCRNRQRLSKGEQIEAIDSEVAIARTQPPSVVFWQRLKSRQKSGKFYNGRKEGSMCALIEAVGMGFLQAPN